MTVVYYGVIAYGVEGRVVHVYTGIPKVCPTVLYYKTADTDAICSHFDDVTSEVTIYNAFLAISL